MGEIEKVVTVLDIRYWFHVLYGLKRAVAAVNRHREQKIAQHTIPPAPVNAVMRTFCLWEAALLGPLRLPFGTSIVAVVRRQPGDAAANPAR